jgi:hypothetical protein
MGQGFWAVRVIPNTQVSGIHLSDWLHLVALIWGGFATFCSQICSQVSDQRSRRNRHGVGQRDKKFAFLRKPQHFVPGPL